MRSLVLSLLVLLLGCGAPPEDAPNPSVTPLSEIAVYSDGADLLIFDGYKTTTYRPAGLLPDRWYYIYRDGSTYATKDSVSNIKDYVCAFRTQATAAIVQFTFEGRMWTYRSPQLVLSGGRSTVRAFLNLGAVVPPHINRPYMDYRFLAAPDPVLFDLLWLDYDQQVVPAVGGTAAQGQLWLYSPKQIANYRVGDARSSVWLSAVGWIEPAAP